MSDLVVLDGVVEGKKTGSVLAAMNDVALAPLRMSTITREIVEEVAHFYGVGVWELEARTRKMPICRIRQVAMYFLYYFGGLSYQNAAATFGRTHVTAMHARGVVESLVGDDAGFEAELKVIFGRIVARRADRREREQLGRSAG